MGEGSQAKLYLTLTSYLGTSPLRAVAMGEMVVESGRLLVLGAPAMVEDLVWVRDVMARRWLVLPGSTEVVVIQSVVACDAEFVPGRVVA